MVYSRIIAALALVLFFTSHSVSPSRAYAQDEFAEDSDVIAEDEFSEDAADAEDFSDEEMAAEESFDEEAEIEEEVANEPKVEEEIKDDLEPLAPTEEPQEKVAEPEPPMEEAPEPTLEPEEEPMEAALPPAEPEMAPQETVTLAPDEPDMAYETQLHDIFVNFYNARTPDEEWSSLVGQRQAERYQILSGDNLWNISRTIFGDGNYWPKIWSLNSSITNPHLINPNNVIRFILGDESEPPAFTITEAKSEEPPSAVEAAPSQDVATTAPQVESPGKADEELEPEIPPPLKTSRPVVKRIPPSLPLWQDVAAQGNYDSFGIDYGRRKIIDVQDTVPLSSYIAEEPPENFGRVSEVEVGHNIASAFQYIYVWVKPGQGQVGDTFLVVANRGQVQSVHKSIQGFLGYTIDIQGEIQLVERVAGRKENENGEMYRALVLKIVNPVAVDSVLVRGNIETIQVTEKGPRSQVVAQIIGGSFFNRRQVYGNESIAYLNRGEMDGLRPGQVLPIRANRSIRNLNTEVRSNVRPIGWLRIIKTTPRFATAMVVRAWSDVLSGDLTGSGELLPPMMSNSITQDAVDVSAASLQEEMDDSAPVEAPAAADEFSEDADTDFGDEEDAEFE